ncbi:MAG: RNA-directed DNA polymerase [Phyllobacteriaceae bacterium]|nr:RNA-directed DNA polymerase [Phyllobacteriaceae bacterium]
MAIKPSEARLWRLLAAGYFPAELPPPFQTENFAASAVHFSTKWNHEEICKFWTKPEHYSSPRYGHARRKLSIVNPINQLSVAALLAENWFTVAQRLKRPSVSEFKPRIVLKGKGRAVTGVDFDEVAKRKVEILSKYGRYVKTDIARFYPSIYTHSIAWAIVGKSIAKANHQTAAFKRSFANKIDAAVRAGQEGQTIGIPIGPDTSRVISELIAIEIETELLSVLLDWGNRSVRYVDDMLIGIDETESEADILSKLTASLVEYELELNAGKTKINGLGIRHAPEWIHYIRSFKLSSSRSKQRDDLDSYFEHALFLADENPQENVLLFACKRACSLSIGDENGGHLVRWLLYCCRRAPSCLRFVSEFLAAKPPSEALVRDQVSSFILQQIPRKSEAAHTEELAWLLFWAREIGLELPDIVINSCSHIRSSVVALIALDIREAGNVSGVLDDAFWRGFCNPDGLKLEMWLVAYEASKRQWWSSDQNCDFISKHEFFSDLLAEDVSFYDRSKKAKALRPAPYNLEALAQYINIASSLPAF